MINLELDSLFSDELADLVLYDNGTGAVSVSGIADLRSDGEPAGCGTILVQKSQVPDPGYKDTFTIDGTVWHVAPGKGKDFILEETADTYLLRIQTGERVSAWR